jgi:DNA-binding response OmpR family regulator
MNVPANDEFESMSVASLETQKRQPPAWGTLPRRMRVLFITTSHRTGAWLAEAFAADSASEVILDESIGAAAGMARLRDDIFDAVFISHDPPDLDALEFIQGLRAGGGDEPTVVLGAADDQEMTALTYEAGADAYLCVTTTTIRTLLWSAARAIERHQLLRENRRLIQAERQRLNFEHQEADRLLAQQRVLIGGLETLASDVSPASEMQDADEVERTAKSTARSSVEPLDLPEQLVAHYAELLRAYVIMGSGNLAAEMSTLADLLASASVSPQQMMQLHLDVLEQLVRGLGSRSARHVMSRADLLVLEVMMHLAEDYRQRYLERNQPPQQLTLPGV